MVGPRCLRPYQPLALLPCWSGMVGYPAGGCEVTVWFATGAGGDKKSKSAAVCLRGLQTVCHRPLTEERGERRYPLRGSRGDRKKRGWLSRLNGVSRSESTDTPIQAALSQPHNSTRGGRTYARPGCQATDASPIIFSCAFPPD